jgi:membrane-associated phospholipid phosphatase
VRPIIILLVFLILLSASSAAADPGPPPERGLFRDGYYAGKVFLYDTGYIITSPLRLTGRQALVWGGLFAATAVVYAYDQEILDWLQGTRYKPGFKWFHEMGEFFEPMGHMGVMNKYYIGGLALSYVVKQEKATQIFAEILEAHFIAGMGKNAANALAGRARPHEGQGPYSWGNDGGTSFPSGHAINIFQLATVLSHHANRTWFSIGAYTIAASVGVQRVMSDAHWTSDVIMGAAFGTAVARCVVLLHESYGGPRPMVTATSEGPALGLTWRF